MRQGGGRKGNPFTISAKLAAPPASPRPHTIPQAPATLGSQQRGSTTQAKASQAKASPVAHRTASWLNGQTRAKCPLKRG